MNDNAPLHPLVATGTMLSMFGSLTLQQLVAVAGQALIFVGVYLDWQMSRRLKAQRAELLAIEARLRELRAQGLTPDERASG